MKEDNYGIVITKLLKKGSIMHPIMHPIMHLIMHILKAMYRI
jgi:hypothetical protein